MLKPYIILLILGIIHIGYIFLCIIYPKKRREISDRKNYSIEHIVCFKNEAGFIKEKLDNCYQIAFPCLHHTFVNDNSSDNTLELLEKYKQSATIVINNETDSGKNQSQIRSVKMTNADLVLFSDANVFLRKDALDFLVRHFDENTGGVCGDVTVTTDMKHMELSGKYWEIEKNIKEIQSLSGSVIGFDGGFYCVRRENYNLKEENELSDFETTFLLFEQGKKTRYVKEAIAVERENRRIKDFFKARMRASNRAFWSYSRIFRYIRKLNPVVLIHFTLHKLIRYLFVITFTLSLPFIIADVCSVSPLLLLIFLIPHVYRFVIESIALCIGGIIALTGKEYTTWSNKKF